MNFHLKSISNLEKFLGIKLFLSSKFYNHILSFSFGEECIEPTFVMILHMHVYVHE
jgi:hypothetical protein